MVTDQSVEKRLGKLRIWNIVVGLVLAAQAVVMALLTNNFSLPVTATFMQGPPGSAVSLQHIWDIQTSWGVFAFMVISAAALLIIASPFVFPWYKRNLLESRNYARWIEYFFSASIMIVLISQICGISDIAALLAIFGINACMILFGALQEKYEKPGKPSWLPFWFGSFAGIIPLDSDFHLCCCSGSKLFATRLRLWHHCFPLHLLQLLCRKHGPAIQAGGSLA